MSFLSHFTAKIPFTFVFNNPFSGSTSAFASLIKSPTTKLASPLITKPAGSFIIPKFTSSNFTAEDNPTMETTPFMFALNAFVLVAYLNPPPSSPITTAPIGIEAPATNVAPTSTPPAVNFLKLNSTSAEIGVLGIGTSNFPFPVKPFA